MQRLTAPDVAWFALIVLMTLICFWNSDAMGWVFVPTGGMAVWGLVHLIRLRHLMKKGVPTDAVVVNYSVRTHKIHHRMPGYTEEYQVYAPVLRYETDTQILESTYAVYKRERWFREGESYLICYNPEQPELFWFPERKGELTSDYLVLVIVAAIFISIFGVTILLA